MMTRYKNRKADNMDLVPRFESKSSSEHIRNAIAAIQHLGELGAKFWDDDSDQLHRWIVACNSLQDLINGLEGRRRVEQKDLPTVLREFFQEFEHSTGRMHQMLHGTSNRRSDDQNLQNVFDWFDRTYRFSTYAITSVWIDDKKQESSVSIVVNLITGRRTETWRVKKMKIPKNTVVILGVYKCELYRFTLRTCCAIRNG